MRKSYLDLRIITLLLLLLPSLCLMKGKLREEEIGDGGNLCLYLHQQLRIKPRIVLLVSYKVIKNVVLDDRTTTVAISDESPCYQSHD